MRERVVVDTNVLISGALSTTSTPALAVEKAVRDGQLLASTATMRELMETLLSAKFDPYVARESVTRSCSDSPPSSSSWKLSRWFGRHVTRRMTSSWTSP
jgi:predicted nucleic acid-binding protein